MKSDYEPAEIIDDSSDEEEYVIQPKVSSLQPKVASLKSNVDSLKKPKNIKIIKEKPKTVLKSCYNEDPNVYEIGVDEAGRGPLFGCVYTAAVILPKDDSFDFTKVKDSKKFHSKKKIEEAADYVKQNALAWHVSFEDEKKIDEINILQATQMAMHNAILEVKKNFNKHLKEKGRKEKTDYNYNLLIDGNYFNPIATFNKETSKFENIPYMTVEGGDNKYASIAAASILAKVERDRYIENLCQENPELSEHYGIDSNKGYGAKRHIDGIKEHGITIWHRRTFAPCKNYV
jgi:ribonuclease HII